MKNNSELYLQRAETELVAADILFSISGDFDLQEVQFRLERHYTFYSLAIAHAYYCIFYSAKAVLAEHDFKTSMPDVHKKTLEAFDAFLVRTGILDVKLLDIYKQVAVRAEDLLCIFSSEREKRGRFTYQKLPQANINPAKQSLKHASFFFQNINKVLRK